MSQLPKQFSSPGAPSPQHTSEQPSRNSWGHPISESHLPALSSSPQETFLSEREPLRPQESLAAPGGRYRRHRYRNPHPPGAVAGSQWPVPVPAPPGRPHPPNLERAEHLPPRPPEAKLPGPALASSPGPAGLPSPGPSARRPGPGLTWCPPRCGGAGGGGSGSGLEKEVRAGGRRKWGGRARRRGGARERAGPGRGPTRKSAGRSPPPRVAPSRLAPGRVLAPSPQPFTSEAL